MTKEECEKAYTDFEISREVLKRALENNCELINPIPIFDKANMIFARLIHEHFDNPPLKFEELKVGMWIWDNKDKKYNKIIEINGDEIDFYYITSDVLRYIAKFKPNRFYRKEVQE